MPKILIIDDDKDWCEKNLKTPLSQIGYEVEAQTRRDSAIDLLQRSDFNLVIVNVWLDNGNDEEKIIRQWDELLTQIGDKGIEIIVVTARASNKNIDILLRKAFKYHAVADFLIKEDFNQEEYTQVVVNSIKDHYQKPRVINGREYILRGVNQQIYSFLSYKGVFRKIFKGINDYDDRLYRALGGSQYDENVGEAKSLLSDMWNLEIGLPPYLFIDMLSEFEFGRAYYIGYRDHVTHQLRVYLLGLFFYYGVDEIKKSILQKFVGFSNPEDAFLTSWKIAAVFHDLGYVFEVEKEKSNVTYSKVIDEINDFFEYPYLYYCNSKGYSLLKSQELMVQEKFNLPRHRVESFLDLEEYRNTKVLDDIEELIKPSRLSRQLDGLQRYYQYARQNSPIATRNDAFIDHGIASAVTLLHLYKFFHEYVLHISNAIANQREEIVEIIGADHLDLLEKATYRGSFLTDIIRHASAAIALHNINVDIWDHNDAWRQAKLDLNLYNISLGENPLAFLLCLTDVIQDWDRPRFSSPSPSRSYVSQDQDISIELGNDSIKLDFVSDELKGTSKSNFRNLVSELKKYMNSEDIELLLREAK
jgi:CheY-like chemotaxis protein